MDDGGTVVRGALLLSSTLFGALGILAHSQSPDLSREGQGMILVSLTSILYHGSSLYIHLHFNDNEDAHKMEKGKRFSESSTEKPRVAKSPTGKRRGSYQRDPKAAATAKSTIGWKVVSVTRAIDLFSNILLLFYFIYFRFRRCYLLFVPLLLLGYMVSTNKLQHLLFVHSVVLIAFSVLVLSQHQLICGAKIFYA